MKKVYCFYCQQDVMPKRFLLWQICPHCHHRLTDNGEGFYRVCERCGANMPVNAHQCVKCGNTIGPAQNQIETFIPKQYAPWLIWLLRVAAIFISLLISIGILYISFYLILVLFVLGLAYFIFQLFWPQFRR